MNDATEIRYGSASKAAVNQTRNQLIILGAGRPHSGDQHPVLRGASNQGRVLDWLLQAVGCLSPEVKFVGGYQIEEISSRYPGLHYTFNAEWENTGAAASLLHAPLSIDTQYFISYADVLFHESAVRSVAEASGDIVVAVDSAWRHRFSCRSDGDIRRCEKVTIFQDAVTSLGPDILPEMADAEFVGFVRLSPVVIQYLKANAESIFTAVQHANLSQLLELLRIRGFGVKAVDVKGDWAELNEPRDLTRFIMGTKAQTLHRLQGLVRHSHIADQVSFTVAEWLSAPDLVIRRILIAFPQGRLVVRSSALSEDGFTSANAGAYTSVLGVEVAKQPAVRRAIQEVIASYPDGNADHQVLVQPMIEGVKISGVAFTRTLADGAPYYVINYDDLTHSTDSITNGTSRDHKTLLVHRHDRLTYQQAPEPIGDLLQALHEVEDLLDYDSLDIEFAISSMDQIHVLQVRPIAVRHERLAARDEDVTELLSNAVLRFISLQKPSPFVVGGPALFGVMPDWNPAEIIGTKPGRLAMSLYRFLIMDEVWATQRAEYGYRDVRPHPLMVAFAGHPYVDIRASFNSFVPDNVDDVLAGRLVNFYLDWLRQHPHLHDKVEFDVVPTCFALDFERWKTRLIEKGGFSVEQVNSLGDGLKDITKGAISRTPKDLESIEELQRRFERIMRVDMPELERALVLLEDCQRYGTLAFSHLARSAFVAVTLLKSAVYRRVISQEAANAFLNSIRTITHRLTEDAAATANHRMPWQTFVERYGHLRPGTYDITSPSYLEDPLHFLAPIVERARNRAEDASTDVEFHWRNERAEMGRALAEEGLSEDLAEVEHFMRNAIEGREYAKFVFSRHLSAALDCLVKVGSFYGVSRDDLAHLSLDAFTALRSGNVTTNDIGEWLREQVTDGKRSHQLARMVELPPLLLNEQDFYLFHYPNTQANFVGTGRVIASCVELGNLSVSQTPSLGGKIALIPQADPGFDWIFGQDIVGLITMYGGANSHMAIRAAEFGLPAAIGVGETRYSCFVRASVLELDAANHRIQVLR
ncbi:PEP/pyruvate-binding domain-containing protein [Halomonas nitroreducens]|uniref:PEP-utilising enzyme mobile domain-containing protein n=1 Tax=Halomonas nitroreducens TaxID=447425 RepID=A0A431V4S9_9GAMM|nr:PEP/pyruvate-binding domain-containing protein [Halomonas nitroreducens]RTR05361.1 hypothetical protein EKG36_07185 [Halomonas nitroreducens]